MSDDAPSVDYDAVLHLTGRNTGVPVPDEVLERLGGGRRPRVVVTVNGYTYASTVGAMGGRALVPFSAERRAESGLAGGEPIAVRIAIDTAPREIAVPEDLAAALERSGLTERFAALSPSQRKAHADAVEGAKTAETRERRIIAIVAKLTA